MKEYIIKIADEPDITGGYALQEKAKELVRCKDCKWRSFYCTEATDGTTLYICNYPCANDVPHPADWFCADGERAE